MRIAQRFHNQLLDLDYVAAFCGECLGVALIMNPGGAVSFLVIVEDDDQWLVSSNSGSSTFWLPDLLRQIMRARAWMQDRCFESAAGLVLYERHRELRGLTP